MNKPFLKTTLWALFYLAIAVVGIALGPRIPGPGPLPGGISAPRLVGMVALVFFACAAFSLATQLLLARQKHPPVEGRMLARIYWLVAGIAAACIVAYGYGVLGKFGTAFSMFGGMLLGWSLQAPVSGFAAWVLVLLKRPFRPGDRVQFPSLALTGDIMNIGPMYTVLDQVGGTIASEEAVGRHILVPNAMLFGQVVINYTARQGGDYVLDEVVVRITYDSNWRTAEKVLLGVAREVTADAIAATGDAPYIRADLYDYGVYLRLRYKTPVKDRAETSYLINRRLFEEIQREPSVDLAIPYVYSYRSGHDRRSSQEAGATHLDVDALHIPEGHAADPHDIEQLASSIAAEGLLQPIVVTPGGKVGRYEVVAGHLRLAACRKLGWKTVPAVVRPTDAGSPRAPLAGA